MKFKPVLLWCVVCSLMLQSCFINRYQKVQTAWPKAAPNSSQFTTPDSILRVNYSLWDTKGWMMIKISNQTDSLVYIDPWYTYEILQGKDTIYLTSPDEVEITKYNSSPYLSTSELEKKLYFGDEIPIPPRGEMAIRSACVSCYLGLDYVENDPVGLRDSIVYQSEISPFTYERHIGYAFPSDTALRIVRQNGYVSKIDRYRFVWSIDEIPKSAREDRSFYVHSQRPSVITWFGMIGLGVVYILGSISGEEE